MLRVALVARLAAGLRCVPGAPRWRSGGVRRFSQVVDTPAEIAAVPGTLVRADPLFFNLCNKQLRRVCVCVCVGVGVRACVCACVCV